MPVRAPVAAAAVMALSLLAGCGQTGPLHLPEDAPPREGYLLGGGKKKPKAAKSEAAAAPATAPTPSPAGEVPAEAAPEAPVPTTP